MAHRSARALMFSICLAACTSPVASQEQGPTPIGAAGWAPDGLAYARQVCAQCHAVEAGVRASPDPRAPAFEDLADTPGLRGMALNVWLHSAHEDMPQLMVERDQVEDLAAYLDTLREQ